MVPRSGLAVLTILAFSDAGPAGHRPGRAAAAASMTLPSLGQMSRAHEDEPAWRFMQDGVVFATLNCQGGLARATEFEVAELVDGDGHAVRGRPPTIGAFTGGRGSPAGRGRAGSILALGADMTLYAVPASLRPAYGAHPVSFHVFLRLRPPASGMGRMWNMTMTGLLHTPDTMKMGGMSSSTTAR